MRLNIKASLLLTTLLSFFGFVSCQQQSLPVPHGPTKDEMPLVFIHGLMGSELIDEHNEMQWLTPAQGLGFSSATLSLPLTIANNVQANDALRPGRPLQSVMLLPGIGQQLYAPWLNYASRIKQHRLHNFVYDWRRDNNENTTQFLDYLKWIHNRYHRPARVVAHSMGGMISLAAMNQRPDLIERIVFVGVPFRGGIGYLDNMYLGTPIGLNSRLLSAQVIFSHTSVYSFYPAGQAFENRILLKDQDGNPLPVDFHDVANWRKYGWGPFAPDNSEWFEADEDKQQEYINFLNYALQRGKVFRKAMQPIQKEYPPALVITSKSWPTLEHARMLQSDEEHISDSSTRRVPGWDFENTPRVPGDGSVTYPDTLPPQPIQYKEFLSEYDHSYLLNDPLVQARVAEFLGE